MSIAASLQIRSSTYLFVTSSNTLKQRATRRRRKYEREDNRKEKIFFFYGREIIYPNKSTNRTIILRYTRGCKRNMNKISSPSILLPFAKSPSKSLKIAVIIDL